MYLHVTRSDWTKWQGFALLQKSRRNHCSFVCLEPLSGVVFVPAQELSGTYGLSTESVAESLLV